MLADVSLSDGDAVEPHKHMDRVELIDHPLDTPLHGSQLHGIGSVQTVQKIADFLHAVLEEVGHARHCATTGCCLLVSRRAVNCGFPQLHFLDVVVDMPVGVLTGLQLVAPRSMS